MRSTTSNVKSPAVYIYFEVRRIVHLRVTHAESRVVGGALSLCLLGFRLSTNTTRFAKNTPITHTNKKKQTVTEAEDFGDSLYIILEGLLEYAVKVTWQKGGWETRCGSTPRSSYFFSGFRPRQNT